MTVLVQYVFLIIIVLHPAKCDHHSTCISWTLAIQLKLTIIAINYYNVANTNKDIYNVTLKLPRAQSTIALVHNYSDHAWKLANILLA